MNLAATVGDGSSIAFFTGLVFTAGVTGSFLIRRFFMSRVVQAILGWFSRRPVESDHAQTVRDLEATLREREDTLRDLILAADERIAFLLSQPAAAAPTPVKNKPDNSSTDARRSAGSYRLKGRQPLQPLVVQLDPAPALDDAERGKLLSEAVTEFSRWRNRAA